MVRSEVAADFTAYMKSAVSPYHAVGEIVKRMTSSGFTLLKDDDVINFKAKLKPGGKYLVHRNHSAIMGFVVPETFNVKSSGFTICAGHTDSPCLRIRPVSKIESEGMLQLGCELYGGGLWHTWLDRELGMAGKVIVKTKNGIEEKLVNIDRPVLLIPNLAIHLQTADERSAFKIDKEEHMRPVIAKSIPSSWLVGDNSEHPMVSKILAKELNIEPDTIIDLDISLFDANAPSVWGIDSEFIASGRLDNQMSNYSIFNALSKLDVTKIQDICCAVAFDHEEIGSRTWVGADSDLLPSWLECVVQGLENAFEDFPSFLAICRRSLLISTDGAHGINPNYSSKHQAQHKVKLGDGVVIKTNENQRYTTNGITRAIAVEVCKDSDVKIQNFVVKNTSPCGSTIGPCLASNLTMKALDAGAPQWAMHSIRESCHVDDISHLENFASCFYRNYRTVANNTTFL